MGIKTQSLILGCMTILLWGSIATFSNLLLHLPPFYILAVAFLLGGLPSLIRPREIFPNWKVFIFGVLGYFGYHFFLFYAFRFAPAVEANLINYMWPVVMVLLTPLFFKSIELKWYHLAGAFLAVIGCFLLVFGKVAGEEGSWKGYALAAAAAITWPLYSIGKKKLPPTSVWAIGGFCFGASLLCFITHFTIEPRVVLQSQDAWKLLFLGLGPFGLAFYTWDRACLMGDTRLLGALAYLTPVLSTLGLILFTNQRLSFTTAMAMVLIIGGASSGLLDFLPSKLLKKG